MKIDTLLNRLPAQISNGQKQRVALGRSLVRTPNAFLMDEPLAHLDAKMRHFMRAELKEMQGALSTTTLYVTHDYMEALSLGDRIAILNEGAIEQIGTGSEIYNFPANEFVAKLVGEPEINIFPVRIKKEEEKITLVILGMESGVSSDVAKILKKYSKPELDFGIRAKFIQYHLSEPEENCIKGQVYSFEPIGNRAILLVDVEGVLVRMTVPNDVNIEMNTDVYLTMRIEKALFFDIDDKSLIGAEK
jgi:ABC-type sugar transport system ATPase subunit